jgi:hypothetical protein
MIRCTRYSLALKGSFLRLSAWVSENVTFERNLDGKSLKLYEDYRNICEGRQGKRSTWSHKKLPPVVIAARKRR